MADGSDCVIEFTREGTMSVRNTAGESQILLAGDAAFPYKFISETEAGIPSRSLILPDKKLVEEEGLFLVFSARIAHDRLTLRGQEKGKPVILSRDGVKKVKFPGSVTSPLEFDRQI